MIARKATILSPNNASTDTFSNRTNRRPNSPAPGRHLEEPRPGLQRAGTQDATQQANAHQIFTSGVFSDPPIIKNWKFGVPVLTEGHKRLVMLLREEAQRLYTYNNDLRNRLTGAQREVRANQSTCDSLRNQLRASNEIREQLADELAAAQASLAEMDAMVDSARSKRLSRLTHVTDSQADELRNLGAALSN